MANKDNLRYQIHFVVISKQKRIVEFFRMRWEQPTVQGLTICGGLMFTNDSTMVTYPLNLKYNDMLIYLQTKIPTFWRTLTVQAGEIHGGLMLTRSVTNASMTVRKQKHANWRSKLFTNLKWWISVQCATGTLTHSALFLQICFTGKLFTYLSSN